MCVCEILWQLQKLIEVTPDKKKLEEEQNESFSNVYVCYVALNAFCK